MAPYFQTLLQFGWTAFFTDSPKVAQWVKNMGGRPSFISAVSADFSEETCRDLLMLGAEAWPIIAQHLNAD